MENWSKMVVSGGKVQMFVVIRGGRGFSDGLYFKYWKSKRSKFERQK